MTDVRHPVDSRPVLILAGGTGGHIFPGLAVAAALQAGGTPVRWLGADGGLETRLVPARGIVIDTVAIGGVRGKGWLTRLAMPWRLAGAVLAARRVLQHVAPRSVLALGGYAAGPGGLAAWLGRRPLVVQEQNRVPGLTNRLLARFARRVLVGFADAFPPARHAEWTGNPVRAEIAALPPPAQRFAGRSGRPRLLVLGGSLGARALNRLLPTVLAVIPAAQRPVIRHQSGANGGEDARAAYAAVGVVADVVPFIDDMAGAYAWADFAVCRAGALTLAELAAAGLGALLVPYPYAVDDHQTRNAEAFVAAGAAFLMQERDFATASLAAQLTAVFGDRARLQSMADAARTLAKPDAAQRIADVCLEVAT